MKKNTFVAYYRVSSLRQGMDGLGMEAQRTAANAFIKSRSGTLLESYKEVETGRRKDRPKLHEAIALCRKTKSVLLIAKLDRLSRNAAFTFALRDGGVNFVCVDMPEATPLTIGLLAVIAEDEARRTSERTKAALAEAKRRGIKIGNPNPSRALRLAWHARQTAADAFADKMAPVVREIQKTGVDTLAELAACLNRRGYQTPTGKIFYPQSVSNLLRVMHAT